MRYLLLAAAAGFAMPLAATPAQAGGAASPAFNGSRAHSSQGDFGNGNHRRRGHRGSDGDVIIGDWGDGDWARYNNRTFEPDSYNDWWHERPYRAYPRWVTNGSCDRLWWGGDTLRCSW